MASLPAPIVLILQYAEDEEDEQYDWSEMVTEFGFPLFECLNLVEQVRLAAVDRGTHRIRRFLVRMAWELNGILS